MYEFNRARLDAMNTHYVIYSPDVPVFRTDNGELLDEHWPIHPAHRRKGPPRWSPHGKL
jgi:uncharacterized protein (TIGR02452 family)